MDTQPDITPGDLVTPPCQWKVANKPCRWPRTTLVHGLWLCEVCDRNWWLRLAVRRAKAAAYRSIVKARALKER